MTDELPGLARYIDAVSAPVELSEVIDRQRGRRSRRAVVVAFVAVVAAIVAVVAFVPRSLSDAPPGSTPATGGVSPNPTTVTTLVPPVPASGGTSSASVTSGEPAFLSTTEGWICNAPLRYTTDGGVNWQPIGTGTVAAGDYHEHSCAFERGGRAWIAMYGLPGSPSPSIVQVIAGRHPKATPAPLEGADPRELVQSLAFADALHGWAVTSGSYDLSYRPPPNLYRTTDGGAHWRLITRNAPVSGGLRFTSPTTGWGLDRRRLERTDDGGRTWRTVPIVPTPQYNENLIGGLISVSPFGDRIVVAGFVPTGNFGQLFVEVSNDDGAHWSLQTVSTSIAQPSGTAPWQFVAVDPIHWRVALPYGLVTTDNAGASWQRRTTQLPFSQVTGISFVTPDIGWAAACNGDPCHIALTTDGGRSWQLVDPSLSATKQPIQAGAMPQQAFVAVGPALVAIDTHDPSKRRTLTTFPGNAAINWVTVDRPRGRVYFGVTSGCDPGINGMYAMPISGGPRRKIAPDGNRAAVSPDGTKIAYSVQTDGCGSRDVVVQDVLSGQRQRFSGQRSIRVGAWASDGQSLFFSTESGTPIVYRFRPFTTDARLDDSKRWDTGIVADSGGGRVALLDWCSPTATACAVGVRTRSEESTGSKSFGRVANVESLSIDSSGMWPLLVVDRPSTGNNSVPTVLMFSNAKWRELALGNAADW